MARIWRKNESINLLNQIKLERNDPNALILLGHHENDQQETILMKFLRGVHISNLSGVCINININILLLISLINFLYFNFTF